MSVQLAGVPTPAEPRLTLTFVNDSTNAGTACIYQAVEGMSSLAWLTASTHPATTAAFTWNQTYSFVWIASDALGGALVRSSQVVAADPVGANSVTLYYDAGFTFTALGASAPSGMLRIVQDATVPANAGALVGVGMDGVATVVVATKPNWTVDVPLAAPVYCVAFGSFAEGDVIETPPSIAPLHVTFPEGVTAATVVLGGDNVLRVVAPPQTG
ncbi:MAG TPA: hypothetical protein VGU66_19015 [Candidatus Elarobacter sp.]|nr:hypothetical protein [Candidatus Elarobacter sp.]